MIELLGGYCIKSDRKQFIMGQTRKDKAGHMTRFLLFAMSWFVTFLQSTLRSCVIWM